MSDEGSTPARVTRDLRALGLRSGDLVMVHASLRALGPVQGRVESVIGAVLEAVAPGGTMLTVLGATDDHAWVNERPKPSGRRRSRTPSRLRPLTWSRSWRRWSAIADQPRSAAPP